MTWSWPDKTWNILCSYCLQWNTSQSKFRNHYFLFLFAFSILSQLFLIWGCTRRHVISVSNVTLHSRALYAHSGVPPHTHTQVSPLPLVFVNIKPQNDYLNMTSACLCVNVWRRCVVLFATHTEARVRLAVILTSVASLNEDVNTEQHIQNCSESHFMSIWPLHLSKTILTHRDGLGVKNGPGFSPK